MTVKEALRPGRYWREVRSGRRVKILESEVHGTGPAWCYVNDAGEPDGYDDPADAWHYSDVLNFVLFGEFVPEERPGEFV
jgi:hypothetical protein